MEMGLDAVSTDKLIRVGARGQSFILPFVTGR